MTLRNLRGSVFLLMEKARAGGRLLLARMLAEHGEDMLEMVLRSSRKALQPFQFGPEVLCKLTSTPYTDY